jgi:hypothetical protein
MSRQPPTSAAIAKQAVRPIESGLMGRIGAISYRLAIAGFLFAAGLSGAVGVAAATPSRAAEIQPAATAGSVAVGTRDGYQVYLSMPSDRTVAVEVGRSDLKGERGFFSTARYVARNRSSLRQGLVRARFGSLGAVSLRFRPDGRVLRDQAQPGCDGRPAITEQGTFVGSARFRGEGGYVHFSLSRAAGIITRNFRLRCKRGAAFDVSAPKSLRALVAPGSFFATERDIALLYASSRAHGRYVGIVAGHEEEAPPGAEVRIGALESSEGMAIGRYAHILAPPGTLLTSLPGAHPATATLTAPAPLAGEATYQETSAGSYSWTGSLAMDLFGLNLPLAGPEFHVRLCVLNPLRTRDGCDFFKAEPEYGGERPARPGARAR